jgi:single-stranded-DNA-specific exonuclease
MLNFYLKMLSIKGYEWEFLYLKKKPSPQLIRKYKPFIAQLLANRDLHHFPYLRKIPYLEEENLFPQIDKVAGQIIEAVKEGKPIFIFGDYDADGITSSVLMYQFLKSIGAKRVIVKIPERSEGYGISPKAIELFGKYSENGGLVIMLDNGTKEIETLQNLEKYNLQGVIIDHHTPLTNEEGNLILPSIPLLNPKIITDNPEDPYGVKDLSTAGLVYFLIQYIVKKYPEIAHNFDPNNFLDIVAIGTIGDVSPMSFLNSVLVKEGLEKLNNSPNKVLAKLIEFLNISEQINEEIIGFKIVPRLNAFGRMERAKLAFYMLISKDEKTLETLFRYMEIFNNYRKYFSEKTFYRLAKKFEREAKEKGIIIAGERNIPKGLVSLVAGKLMNYFGVPTIVFSIGKIVSVGSGRSPEGFNILEQIKKFSSYLTRWGGHAQAVGLSIETQNLKNFKKALIEDFQMQKISFRKTLKIDYKISPQKIKNKWSIYRRIFQLLSPYGANNPPPTFWWEDTLISLKKTTYGYVLNFKDSGKFFMPLENRDLEIPLKLLGKKLHFAFRVKLENNFSAIIEDIRYSPH